jgi:pullulanase
MYQSFGFRTDARGKQSISLFIPDNAVDPTQYTRGGPSNIALVSVIGDFQHIVNAGSSDWDPATALSATKTAHPNGWVWQFAFPIALPDGFYQYLFVVQFANGTTRTVGDPCSKYGGTSLDRSAFVVGGTPISTESIANRLPTNDLQIYELMISDFTSGLPAGAPLDVIATKLDYLKSLGINAIEFMPWTAWPDDETFTWGYNPAYFFSIESLFVDDGVNPLNRLSRLANLVTECHRRGIHVLQDIVLQHASQGSNTNGFPYYWLWENPTDSPFVGAFTAANTYGMLPIDYGNACTEQFVVDVCSYWIETFKLDGLRFDEATGFTQQGVQSKGAPGVIGSLQTWLASQEIKNVSLILEDSWGYDAVGDANNMNASGTWFDMFRSVPFGTFSGFIQIGQMSSAYMRTLNSSYQFNFPISPVTYIENHDHSTVTYLAGGRDQWAETQPYLIALATCPGAIMIHNGQEWGQVEELWENDMGAPKQFQRVQPRPLDWSQEADATGTAMHAIYAQLMALRQTYSSLRSPNFYPDAYDLTWTQFSPDGYGIDVNRKIVIYHRFGPIPDGKTERMIVVLNFTGATQNVDIPFPIDGSWTDMINNSQVVEVTGFKLSGYPVPSNWGCVFWIES